MVIYEKGREIEEGRIIIEINYREIFRILMEGMKTVNQYIREGAVEVVKIKRLVDNTRIDVEF